MQIFETALINEYWSDTEEDGATLVKAYADLFYGYDRTFDIKESRAKIIEIRMDQWYKSERCSVCGGLGGVTLTSRKGRAVCLRFQKTRSKPLVCPSCKRLARAKKSALKSNPPEDAKQFFDTLAMASKVKSSGLERENHETYR